MPRSVAQRRISKHEAAFILRDAMPRTAPRMRRREIFRFDYQRPRVIARILCGAGKASVSLSSPRHEGMARRLERHPLSVNYGNIATRYLGILVKAFLKKFRIARCATAAPKTVWTSFRASAGIMYTRCRNGELGFDPAPCGGSPDRITHRSAALRGFTHSRVFPPWRVIKLP